MRRIQDFGSQIRKLRSERGFTQAELAQAAKVSRTTLKQLETGLLFEVGLAKVLRILSVLEQRCELREDVSRIPDFVALACTAASVSFKTMLTEQDLIRAFLAGEVAEKKRPHLRTLLEESSDRLRIGLLAQVGAWTSASRLEKNLARVAETLRVTEEVRKRWIDQT
jgi:transcriptional regulator with XRE-family HTH domain